MNKKDINKKDMIVKVVKKGATKSEALDPYVIVEVTDVETQEKGMFKCRNIFDFGYVINPCYPVAPGLEPGGAACHDKKTGKWYWEHFEAKRGWYKVREMTEFETKAYQYLKKFPPISAYIRM